MGIKISNKRYEEIKTIVVNLLTRYNISCFPINGFEIATKMGIKVIPYSAVSLKKRLKLLEYSDDGCSIYKNGEWRIYYNDNDKTYGRINHTIMHEVGHIVLEHSEDSDLAEKEVRFFAKYALVPPVLVHKLELNDPQTIATIFDVSLEAACYAFEYYKKWRQFGGSSYRDYELKMLSLFKEVC